MSWSTPPKKKAQLLPDWTPEWLHVAIRVFFNLALLGAFISCCVGGYYFHKANQFDLDEVEHPQTGNVLLDHKGRSLSLSNAKADKLAHFNDLPQHLIDALIAREDARFMEHGGIDFRGVARAVIRNVKDRSFTQGASTLSMQLARNTFNIRAKSLNRKFLESALTLRIENRYSKKEIMAHYLNRIYFGSGCYGVEQAAQKYFGVTTAKMNLSQCALIVGIIRGPHIFSPLRNLEAAIEQRDQVLARMIDTGSITPEMAEAAKKQDLNIQTPKEDEVSSTGSYARNAVDRHLNEILESEDIRSGGVTVTTSIDAALNERCQGDIQRICNRYDGMQGACLVLDHRTGAVRAIVGGSNFEESSFNRALVGKMELGDAFTPFLYAMALERGELPIKGKPAQTGRQVNDQDILRLAKRFGFDDPFSPDDIYAGRTTTNPLKLATAFACIGNEGLRPTSYFIDSVNLRDDSLVFKNQPHSHPVIAKGNAQQCLQFLRRREGNHVYTTTAFKKSVWCMATGKNLTAVAWIGYDTPQNLEQRTAIMQEIEKSIMQWLR